MSDYRTWGEHKYKALTRKHINLAICETLGLRKAPDHMETWHIAGVSYVGAGETHPGTEPQQMISEGFETAEQFNGVDFGHLKLNQKANPGTTFHAGEFTDVFKAHHNNPCYINLDSTVGPKDALPLLFDTLGILEQSKTANSNDPCIVLCNMITSLRGFDHMEYSKDDIFKLMRGEPGYKRLCADWKLHPDVASYLVPREQYVKACDDDFYAALERDPHPTRMTTIAFFRNLTYKRC